MLENVVLGTGPRRRDPSNPRQQEVSLISSGQFAIPFARRGLHPSNLRPLWAPIPRADPAGPMRPGGGYNGFSALYGPQITVQHRPHQWRAATTMTDPARRGLSSGFPGFGRHVPQGFTGRICSAEKIARRPVYRVVCTGLRLRLRMETNIRAGPRLWVPGFRAGYVRAASKSTSRAFAGVLSKN